MMEGWKEYRIDDIAEVVGGGTPSSKIDDYWNGDISWITPNDLSGYSFKTIKRGSRNISKIGLQKSSAKLHPINTVLFTSRAPIGYMAIAKTEVATNQGFQSLRCKSDLADYNFIYYYLTIYRDAIASIASGATFPEISGKKLKQFKITIPSLPAQRKIAKILSAYDDLIENNLKRIKLLEEMAQKTYEEWFVFRKIDNQLINDSQIELQNLEDLIVNYMNGGWGKETEEGNYTVPAYVIRGTDMPDISSGSFDKLPLRFHTGSNFKSRELKYGDVIIEMSNGNMDNVGRSFYYDKDFGKLIEYPAMCASFCKMLRPKSIELSYVVNSHIKYIYTTNRMLVYKSQAANGINNFRFEDMIADEVLSIPKGDLMNKLVATLKPKYELISNIRNQIRLLKEARDILLPRLMTGMIDVEKLELKL